MEKDSDVMRIADEFLKNPFTSYLAKNEGIFSVQNSSNRLGTNDTNILSSIDLSSPNRFNDTRFRY